MDHSAESSERVAKLLGRFRYCQVQGWKNIFYECETWVEWVVHLGHLAAFFICSIPQNNPPLFV